MQVTQGTVVPGGGRSGLASGTGLTIGNFDGVHRGHRAMLQRLVEKSRELRLPCSVLTFEPHPREFFSPLTAPARLSRLREKLELIAETGIQRTHVLRFGAQLAALAADRFVEEVLVRGLGVRWLLVGPDFRFGAKRAGDFATLQAAAAGGRFAVEAMDDVMEAGQRLLSSNVRALLSAGPPGGAGGPLRGAYNMEGGGGHRGKVRPPPG